MKISTPIPEIIQSKVELAQKMLMTVQMIRPIRAIIRNDPQRVRSLVVK